MFSLSFPVSLSNGLFSQLQKSFPHYSTLGRAFFKRSVNIWKLFWVKRKLLNYIYFNYL